MSYSFVYGTLTLGQFDRVLESLRALHNFRSETPPNQLVAADLYSNWGKKVRQRWTTRYEDCYRNFEGADVVVPRILHWLDRYESENRGQLAHIIHGDAVFTNAILTVGEPGVAWVDMRGELGSNTTSAGDLFYDWGKVLQSLLGYDFVLLNIAGGAANANSEYTMRLRNHFEKRFKEWYGETAWGWLHILR
jgi:aminoglycoside phosphotransferase (APT) family kinase protein